ncbi:MAG: hypothetical protein U0894_19060 [Pirellulales bacterium]
MLERLGQSQGDDAKWLLLELQRHRVELGDTTAIVLKLAKDSPESVKVISGKLLLGKKDTLPTEALEVVAKLAWMVGWKYRSGWLHFGLCKGITERISEKLRFVR